MNGYDYVREGIELFEASLADGRTPPAIRGVASLAARTGYSVRHFERLFYAITGSQPKDYIRDRILSVAARRILETRRSLRDIAEELGFEDYETFSRSMKARFGISPKAIREAKYLPTAETQALSLPPEPIRRASGLESREPTVQDEPERTVAGLSFFMEDGARSFHKPWATFMKASGRVVGRALPERYYQCSAWSDEESLGGIAILCGLETERDAVQEPVFAVRRLPASRCLRFVHRGDVRALHETYRYIYQEYLPANAVRPSLNWEFQRYGPDGETEICIPVA